MILMTAEDTSRGYAEVGKICDEATLRAGSLPHRRGG
jgi:hypothetical protein